MKPNGTAWPARSPELPSVLTKAGDVVKATNGSVTEIMGRLNLTHDAGERVAGKTVMMTEAWGPAGGGHPRKSH